MEAQVQVVREAFEKCCRKCSAILPGFKVPSLEFTTHGNTAGWAHYRENKVRLNPTYCMSHLQDMLEDTVPHELAHILAYQIYGENCHHDWRWKDAYKLLTGKTPSRCHDYGDVKSASRMAAKNIEAAAAKLLRELGE